MKKEWQRVKNPTGIMNHNQKEWHLRYRNFLKETRKGERPVMAEMSPNLGEKMNIQIHQVQRTSNRMNLNRATLRHIIVKLPKVKDKERILRAVQEKVTHKGTPKRLLTHFSQKHFSQKSKQNILIKEWDDILKLLEENNCQPSILYWLNCPLKQSKDKDFPEQITSKGVPYHYIYLTKDANGSSLSKGTIIITKT